MQQQDSHELLRYLMDNMKTEEIKVNLITLYAVLSNVFVNHFKECYRMLFVSS